jgi:hypothetical protein
MIKHDIEVFEVIENEEYIIFRWDADGVGFGEIVIDAKTHEIVDDEYMGEKFANKVIEIGLKKLKEA